MNLQCVDLAGAPELPRAGFALQLGSTPARALGPRVPCPQRGTFPNLTKAQSLGFPSVTAALPTGKPLPAQGWTRENAVRCALVEVHMAQKAWLLLRTTYVELAMAH